MKKKKTTSDDVTQTTDYARLTQQPWFEEYQAEMQRQGLDMLTALQTHKPIDWVFALKTWNESAKGFAYWHYINIGWVRQYLCK